MKYCIDTSILLDNPKAILSIGDKDDSIILPFCVLSELDNNKTRGGIVGRNARHAIKTIDSFRHYGNLNEGIKLDSGVEIFVDFIQEDVSNDQKIIKTAQKNKCKLITNDIAMRIQADALGIESEGFDEATQNDIYSGVITASVDGEFIDRLYKVGKITLTNSFIKEYNIFPNQMIIFKSNDSKQGALARASTSHGNNFEWTASLIIKNEAWGISARNKEQEFALNLLGDPDVHLVSMVGHAGTGKSYIALASGLEQVIEQKIYESMIIIRPIVSVGNEMGYLPGTLEEKLDPWTKPIHDNLKMLIRNQSDINMYFMTGQIQVEAMSYIRGRSIPNSFIIVDEAQNISQQELKTILTRAADGSKIVLTGDIEQIDKHNLDTISNGLSVVIEKMKGYSLSGHITLTKGQRSPLASICAEVL